MTLSRRVALGGLIGALLVLLFHPISGALFRLYLPDATPKVEVPSAPPGNQRTRDALSVVNLLQLDRITPETVREARSLAEAHSELEFSNAFWWVMLTAIALRQGDFADARDFWTQASRSDRWMDYESVALAARADRVQGQWGAEASWVPASVRTQRRSLASLHAVESARLILGRRDATLEMRLATAQVGRLLREGARTIADGERAERLLSLAISPGGLPGTGSDRVKTLAERAFLAELRDANFGPEADVLTREFALSESWRNVVQSHSSRERRWQVALQTVLLAGIPGALLLGSLVCLGLGLMGMALERVRPTSTAIEIGVPSALGIGSASLMLQFGDLLWPAIFSFIAFLSLAWHRHATRPLARAEAPNTFWTVVVTCVVLFVVPLLAFCLGLSLPARVLYPALGLPVEFQPGSTFLLASQVLALAVISFSATVWSWLDRCRPLPLFGLSLRALGLNLALGLAVATVLLTPISILMDRHLYGTARLLLVNETAVVGGP